MNHIDNLLPDFSRDAVFRPGSIQPFEFWETALLDQFDSSNVPLTAWWAANFSHLAYCPKEKIRVMLKGRGELVQFFESRTQLSFAVQVKDTLFIVFQGSCSGEDALLDVKFFPVNENGVNVHRGFRHALDIIWPQLEEFLRVNEGMKICYTGHSLGGAMAQIASVRMPVDAVYTFGSPRAGSKAFTDRIKGPFWRFVDCSDAATWAPPACLGFRHCRKPVFIDSEQKIHFESDMTFRAAQRMKSSFSYAAGFNWCRKGNALTRSLVDHAPVNYCKALSRHLLSIAA